MNKGSSAASVTPLFLVLMFLLVLMFGNPQRAQAGETVKDADYYINMGKSHALINQLEQAALAYEKALAIDSTNADVWMKLGKTYAKLERWEEALRAFGQSASINPRYAPTHFGMGRALSELYRWEEAIDAYKKAVVIDPYYKEAYNNLGWCYENSWDFLMAPEAHRETWNAAIDAYRKAVEIDSTYVRACINLGWAYIEIRQHDEAIEIARHIIKLDSTLEVPYTILGWANAAEGNWTEAIQAFEELVARDSSESEYYSYLGAVYYQNGQYENAIEAYRKAIALNPRYLDNYSRVAMIYAQSGDLDKTAEVLEEAALSDDHYIGVIRINPNFLRISLKDESWTREKFLDWSDIEALFKQAVDSNPANPQVHYNLAIFFTNQYRHEEAIESLEKVVSLEPGHAKAHFWMGMNYLVVRREDPDENQASTFGDKEAALRQEEILEELNPALAEELGSFVKGLFP